jgi:hypothetical protein
MEPARKGWVRGRLARAWRTALPSSDRPRVILREMASEELTEDDRRLLWAQFVEVYTHAQESYDTSIRALASAGVGVTASLGATLHKFPSEGIAAVAVFLSSLTLNLLSYGTAQFDMRARLRSLGSRTYEGAEGNRWTSATSILNFAAGAAFVAGGLLLALFVSAAT